MDKKIYELAISKLWINYKWTQNELEVNSKWIKSKLGIN
jgi:hypothetical protein